MSILYFGEGVALKSYSALTKSGKSVVKIELGMTDPFDMADVLRQLDQIERDRKAALKPAGKAPRAAKAKPLALPAPPLQLPYFGEGD